MPILSPRAEVRNGGTVEIPPWAGRNGSATLPLPGERPVVPAEPGSVAPRPREGAGVCCGEARLPVEDCPAVSPVRKVAAGFVSVFAGGADFPVPAWAAASRAIALSRDFATCSRTWAADGPVEEPVSAARGTSSSCVSFIYSRSTGGIAPKNPASPAIRRAPDAGVCPGMGRRVSMGVRTSATPIFSPRSAVCSGGTVAMPPWVLSAGLAEDLLSAVADTEEGRAASDGRSAPVAEGCPARAPGALPALSWLDSRPGLAPISRAIRSPRDLATCSMTEPAPEGMEP